MDTYTTIIKQLTYNRLVYYVFVRKSSFPSVLESLWYKEFHWCNGLLIHHPFLTPLKVEIIKPTEYVSQNTNLNLTIQMTPIIKSMAKKSNKTPNITHEFIQTIPMVPSSTWACMVRHSTRTLLFISQLSWRACVLLVLCEIFLNFFTSILVLDVSSSSMGLE